MRVKRAVSVFYDRVLHFYWESNPLIVDGVFMTMAAPVFGVGAQLTLCVSNSQKMYPRGINGEFRIWSLGP